jgi:hypothetical protein
MLALRASSRTVSGAKPIIKPLKELLTPKDRKYVRGNATYEFFVVKAIIVHWSKNAS